MQLKVISLAGYALALLGARTGFAGPSALTARLEPATGAYWYTTGSDPTSSDSTLFGEWRKDDTFESHAAPFGPFTLHDPRNIASDGSKIPMTLAGNFGVLADRQYFYRRDANGVMTPTKFFAWPDPAAADAGPVPCPADPALSSCLFFKARRDAEGREFTLSVFPPDFQTGAIAVQDGAQFRPASGPEAQIQLIDFFGTDSDPMFYRSPAGDVLVGPDVQAFDHLGMLRLAEGKRESKTLDLGQPAFFVSPVFFRRDGQIYIMAVIYSTTAVTRQLFRLADAYSDAPRVERIALLDAFDGSRASAATATHLLVSAGKTLTATALADGKVTDVFTCSRKVVLLVSASANTAWAACGHELRAIEGDQVVATRKAPARVASGLVIDARPEAPELSLTLADGRLARISGAVASALKVNYAPIAPKIFSTSWMETDGPCGVTGTSETATVWCRKGLAWTDVTADHPHLFATSRTAAELYGLASEGSNFVLYGLPKDAAGWRELGRFQNTFVPGQLAPRLVSIEGRTGIAVDSPLRNSVWILGANGLVQSNTARRATTDALPVLDGAGFLYSHCFFDASGRQIQALCRIDANGAVTRLDGPNVVEASAFTPLKRGVLYDGQETWVYRNGRGIRLGTLYGELRSLPERPLTLEFFPAADGRVVIKRTSKGVPPHFFAFDGTNLSDLGAGRDAAGNDMAVAVKSLSAPTETLLWQDAAGFYREGEVYSALAPGPQTTAVAALSAEDPASANRVTGMARHGDQLIFATDEGLIACAENSGAAINSILFSFGVTPGCKMVRGNGPVAAMVAAGGAVFIQEGLRIVRLTAPDWTGGEVVSRGTAAELNRDGDDAVWREGGEILTAAASGNSIASPAPDGAARGAARFFACTKEGLFSRTDLTATWELKAGTPCLGMAANGQEALALSASEAWHVTADGTATSLALPRLPHEDAALGARTAADGTVEFSAAIGTKMYRLEASGFVEVTSVLTRGGELVMKTRSDFIDQDLVGLDGGGALVLGDVPRFFRLR